MATKRTTYANEGTDIATQDDVRPSSDHKRRTSKIEALFPKEFHAKDPEKTVITEKDGSVGTGTGADLPVYEGEEYAREEDVVAISAEDLVTRVINVEDDPTLDPWTFRTFFLGMLIQNFY
jgi:hypothetical protein